MDHMIPTHNVCSMIVNLRQPAHHHASVRYLLPCAGSRLRLKHTEASLSNSGGFSLLNGELLRLRLAARLSVHLLSAFVPIGCTLFRLLHFVLQPQLVLRPNVCADGLRGADLTACAVLEVFDLGVA